MTAAELVKDIKAKNLKAVQDRLKKEKPSIKYTPDPKSPNCFFSVLHVAVTAGDVPVFEAILNAATDATTVDNDGSTPLHWAARRGVKDGAKIAGLLLKRKAKADALDKAGLAPLHIAAAAGSLDVVDVLLKHGAETDGPSGCNCSPLQWAVRACADRSLQPPAALAVVDRLLAAGGRLAAKDREGLTPLHRLVAADRVAEAVQLLERPGCGVDEPDAAGCSLLLREVSRRGGSGEGPRLELVRALVAGGASADMQAPDGDRDTPLHTAARRSDAELVAALLPACKLPHGCNARGATAAELALQAAAGGEAGAAAAAAAVAEAILAAGGDPGEAGPALLRAAVQAGADGVVAKLVPLLQPSAFSAAGLDFAALADAGLPKAAAAYLQRFEPQQAAGGPLDAAANTRLHAAADTGAPYDLIRALAALGLNPSAANAEGDTPLHVAARAGHVEACRALVDAGADVLKRNAKNRTPRGQLKLPEATKDYLAGAEEAFKAAREARQSSLWDHKMKATQTESAFGLRVV